MFDAFPALKPPTAFQIIGWWEFRRLVYNAVLAVMGVATYIGVIAVVGPHIPPGQDVIEPVALVLVIIPRFFLIANLCYTPSWIVDLILRRFQFEVSDRLRFRAFGAGILFSCLVTSVPFWWACIYWIGKPVVPQ
jgi:hypothetical protein